MRALITGVTGFAGSHLAEHLLSCGDEVLGCSRGARWQTGSPDALTSRVPVFCWNLANGLTPDAVSTVVAFAPDVIYHLAAISVPSQCGEFDPTPHALAVNVEGTRSVLELARTLPQPPRMVFSSSCHVYGWVSPGQPVVTEETPLNAEHAYAKTKLAAEQIVRRAALADEVDAVVARAFHHAGPRQSLKMILPDWAHQFASPDHASVRVLCLDAYLDLSDVRDVVRAYRSLAVSGQSSEVYNVGSGRCSRSGDLLHCMLEISGTPRKVVELAPGRRQHPIADITRLVTRTQWRPTIPLETTIRDTMQFWKERKAWS